MSEDYFLYAKKKKVPVSKAVHYAYNPQVLGCELGRAIHLLQVSSRGSQTDLHDQRRRGFHRMLCKFTKTKSIYPTDDSIRKSIYLSILEITKKWTIAKRK